MNVYLIFMIVVKTVASTQPWFVLTIFTYICCCLMPFFFFFFNISCILDFFHGMLCTGAWCWGGFFQRKERFNYYRPKIVKCNFLLIL